MCQHCRFLFEKIFLTFLSSPLTSLYSLDIVFRSIRQELAILVPLKHPNIIDLLGIGLSPLRLLVEFAPERSLDRILRSYKNAGRKLDPYTIQESIIQVG